MYIARSVEHMMCCMRVMNVLDMHFWRCITNMMFYAHGVLYVETVLYMTSSMCGTADAQLLQIRSFGYNS